MTENEEHKNEHASSEEVLDEIETAEEEEDFDEDEDEGDEDDIDDGRVDYEEQLRSLLGVAHGEFYERLQELWEESQGSFPILACDSMDIPECDVDSLIDGGFVDDETRIEELRNGAPISEEERESFESSWSENQIDEGGADYMELVEVKGKFVLLSTPGGHMASQGEISVEGIFDSTEEALKHLKVRGKYQEL